MAAPRTHADGTSGIAYFLITLHRVTGEPRFKDAALKGARLQPGGGGGPAETRYLKFK